MGDETALAILRSKKEEIQPEKPLKLQAKGQYLLSLQDKKTYSLKKIQS